MTSFLDLAGELRNDIYDLVLSRIFSPNQLQPWDSPLSPSTFRSLLLCNKQVHREVQSLLREKYAANLTLHCDNIAALLHYHHQHYGNRVLRHARFNVRDICPDLDERLAPERDWMVALLKSQPGFKYWWLERNALYWARSIRRAMFEEREFQYIEDRAATGCLDGVGTCAGYRKLEYPTLRNGCKITAYTWVTQTKGRHSLESGSMVLEGRLRDLFIDDELRGVWEGRAMLWPDEYVDDEQ